MTDDDGVSLTSIAHPMDPPTLRDAALEQISIKLDSNTIVKQAFEFHGRCEYVGSPRGPLKAMIDAVYAWLDEQPKVARWRRGPEFNLETDFAARADYITVSGRGWFDVDVRLGDMKPIFKEL